MEEDSKSKFRKYALSRIKKRKTSWYKTDRIINSELYNIVSKNGYKTIMLFIPLKNEVNINPLIKRLKREGKTLYVPFMEGKSFKLVKYRLPLHKKRFGIKEPNISKIHINSIDLAVIPILGVDRSCRRIGFGKGMYDRFFEKCGGVVKLKLFIQRELLISKKVVTDSYDVKGNLIFSTSIKTVDI
jgi:5-formyltetrahydrofolate cyclo-ligase